VNNDRSGIVFHAWDVIGCHHCVAVLSVVIVVFTKSDGYTQTRNLCARCCIYALKPPSIYNAISRRFGTINLFQ
jgi:hypothetical protein